MRTECCGDCKWHRWDEELRDWACANSDSDNYTYCTNYYDKCEEYDER